MSLPQQTKPNESKGKSKFQSLNINNLYQGAANKTTSKNLPQKHGLQSLGKVPTARRAPANLPSVKSEKGGNDPSVVLVPSGGSGWAKDGEKPPGLEKDGEGQNSSHQQDVKKEPPVATKPSGPKSWSSVTGASQPPAPIAATAAAAAAAAAQTRPAYAHQKSPLFGQDFPTLRTGEPGAGLQQPLLPNAKPGSTDPLSDHHLQQQQLHQQQQQLAASQQIPAGRSPLEPPAGKEDPAYGPGPNLRPQTFGNWTQGGIKPPGVGSSADSPPEDGIAPLIPPQPHKPTPPQPHVSHSKSPPPRGGSNVPAANQYKSIMPAFMEALELPSGPPEGMGGRRGANGNRQPAPRREYQGRHSGPASRPQTEFTPPPIINKAKLERMDDLADDWTYDDDNFDYNKKLQSDDEDNEVESSRADPNWADQVEKVQTSAQQPYNFYEDMKKSAVGFVMDEDERRRTKKSEEVSKNLERARQRREEEENRYRRQSSSEEYFRGDERHPSGNSRRFDEKENKAPVNDRRGDWNYDDKRNKGRQFDDRRDGGGGGGGRFDDRHDRYESSQRRDGYYPAPRFERRDREEKGGRREEMGRKIEDGGRRDEGGMRRDDYRKMEDQNQFDGGDFKGHSSGYHGSRGRDPMARGFDERSGGRSWEEEHGLDDSHRNDDKRRNERRWSGRSPPAPYHRQESLEKSHSGSPEVGLENGSDCMPRPGKTLTDWVEDVEEGDRIEKLESDRPSRPNSRDSRVSKDSRGSKESKGPRQMSGEKILKKMDYSDKESMRKFEKEQQPLPVKTINPLMQDYEGEKKMMMMGGGGRKPPQQDLRGYFRDAPSEEKKSVRAAPGPITREKLEAAENREMTMTQLKKRENSKSGGEPKPLDHDDQDKLAPLIDADLLENISEDEDPSFDAERDDKGLGAGRGRGGRAVRGGQDSRSKFATHPQRGAGDRGGRGDRESRGNRGARGDTRAGRGGQQNRWSEADMDQEESNEEKKNKKNREDRVAEKFNQPPPVGFMPRGQPSRRGRGEGRGRGGNMGGRGGSRSMGEGQDHYVEDLCDWSDERGGKPMPPRMQRKKEEMSRHRFSNKAGNDGDMGEMEEWETASENSNEEKGKNYDSRRDVDRGRGRGKAWGEQRGRRGGMAAPGPLMGPNVGHDYGRDSTPEAGDPYKKRGGAIDNFDLTDYASVVVVDQGENQGHSLVEQEFEPSDVAGGEFMQVVNRKVRPGVREDRRSFERTGPKMMNDKPGGVGVQGYGGGGGPNNDYKYREYKESYDKKMNKTSYDRRQSKLPPRLAKQREVSRAQARTGCSPTGMEQNGWPDDKMGVFQVEDLGTTAWEKPPSARRDKDGSEGPELRASPKINKENGGIQQTMVFENTALKGGKGGDKMSMDKNVPIQLPMGMGKQEDTGDLKLDFAFGGSDDLSSQGKPPISLPRSLPHLAASQGLPASPSTDDLSAKLANTKKLWDAPGMPVVPENSAATATSSWNDGNSFNENSGFDGFQDPGSNQSPDVNVVYDKNENGGTVSNVAKVKPQQQQQLSLDADNRPSPMQYNRMTNTAMPGAIPSPPTQIGQMGPLQAQPWAFQLDRTSPLYNPYGASQLNQSILMPGTHSIGTDLFTGSNGAGGYRLQGTAGHYPGSQQSTTNNVLISQANLISGGVKHSNQIGPIGTKAGTGANTSPYLQSGLGTLPNTYIQYEPGNYNYVNANAAGLQRGNAPPNQTAFYQTIANRQPQLALNALQGSYNHALSQQQQQQLRAGHVAGLPFMKNEMSGMGQPKSPLNDNFGSGPNYSNGGRSQGGPPSPKTKLKMEQQQQQQHQHQAAAAAKMGVASLNNLNSMSHLAQMRMNSLSYNLGMAGVQPGYNPSPIARPQMNPQSGMGHSVSNKVSDYYTSEGAEDKFEGEGDADKGVGEGGKDGENSRSEDQKKEAEISESAK